MNYTANYKLPQWVETDRILMEDFNEAMAKIDEGIEKVKGDTATELEETNRNLGELAADLGSSGKNLRIVTGSYVGTGTYGESNPTSLTFDLNPLIIFFSEEGSGYLSNSRMIWPIPYGTSTVGDNMAVTWGNKSVSWYTLASINQGIQQNNTHNTTYRYTVLGYDD